MSIDPHPGVERVHRYLDSLAEGRLEEVGEYFADDIVWRVAGNHRLAGEYRGRDSLVAYLKEVRELTGGSLKVEPSAVLSSDMHAAMFARVSADRDGRKSLDVQMTQCFKFAPDGKWSEYWALSDDQGAVDAFWA